MESSFEITGEIKTIATSQTAINHGHHNFKVGGVLMDRNRTVILTQKSNSFNIPSNKLVMCPTVI